MLRIDPYNAHAYHNRGISLEKIGETDKAIADFTKVLELDSLNANVEDIQAELIQKLHQSEEANKLPIHTILTNSSNSASSNKNNSNSFNNITSPDFKSNSDLKISSTNIGDRNNNISSNTNLTNIPTTNMASTADIASSQYRYSEITPLSPNQIAIGIG